LAGRVQIQVDGPIGWLILDNPERRNAVDLAMYEAIAAAAGSLAATPGMRLVVIRGAGDEAFNAGSDISEFTEKRMGAEAAASYAAVEHRAHDAVLDLPMPVLAMIHGPCMGGGTALALCADLCYAADDASFAVPPARLGVGYPPRGSRALAQAVGSATALELIYTASPVDAAEALRIGLVNEVVAKDQLENRVRDVAARIAANAPLTLRAAKLALRSDPAADAAAAACFDSADYREGLEAFAAKRRPEFEGR
jgi:enoyl-CoA hydratase